MKRRNLFLLYRTCVLMVLSAFFPVVHYGFAEEAAEADEPETNQSFLRAWIMIPSEVPADDIGEIGSHERQLQLSMQAGNQNERVIFGRGYPFQRTGYWQVRPGRYVLSLKEVFDDAEPRVIQTRDIHIRGNQFYTVVISGNSASPQLEVMDDSELTGIKMEFDKEKSSLIRSAPPHQTSYVYNFVPDSTLVCRIGERGESVSVGYGERSKLPPSRDGEGAILTTVSSRSDKEVTTNIEVDLNGSSYSIMNVEDIYGRAVTAVIPNCSLD